MDASSIALQRLHHQRISHQPFASPVEVATWLGAIQAQDYTSAKWTIGIRLPASTEGAVEQAILDRTLVRTWALRGTLHLLAAADVRWMLTLLSSSIRARFAARLQQLGLDPMTLAKSHTVIANALQGSNHLTRKDLYAALEQAGISAQGERGLQLLWTAALDQLICLGPFKGKQESFVLLDEWVTQAKVLVREEALAELASRYFISHGPATLQDFAWWTGLPMADARTGLEAVTPQLVHDSIEGQSYWQSHVPWGVHHHEPAVYLLPGFDEYLLGYRDRSAVLDASHSSIITGKNAVFRPTMIRNGRVVGIWNRTFAKGAIQLTLIPFAPLDERIIQAFTIAARRYGEFLEMPVVLF